MHPDVRKWSVHIMGKRFTEEEMEILRQHPAVRSVNNHVLQFTPEFKLWFYREHQSGKRTPRILTDAGFDLAMLGTRRIQSIRTHIVEWFEKMTLRVRKKITVQFRPAYMNWLQQTIKSSVWSGNCNIQSRNWNL